jgi:hypothetical protein
MVSELLTFHLESLRDQDWRDWTVHRGIASTCREGDGS